MAGPDVPTEKKKSLKDLDNEEMAASVVLAKAVSSFNFTFGLTRLSKQSGTKTHAVHANE